MGIVLEGSMEDKKIHECFECGAEFTVDTAFDDDEYEVVSFCPFCGSEMEFQQDDDDDFPDDE